MNEYGFGITLEDIEAYLKKDAERKRKNHKNRKDGETFGSELIAGTASFDIVYGEEFYNKAVKQNGSSLN
jgi:hypothetical protein